MATHAHAKACRRSHQISWLTPSTRRCTQILMRLCVQLTRGTETFSGSVGWQEIGERMFQIIFFVPLSKSTVLCQAVFGTQVLHSTLHACAKSELELWFMTTTKWLGTCGRPVLHWLASNLIIYGMRILCPKWLWKLDIDEIWIRHLLNVNRWQAPWNVGR